MKYMSVLAAVALVLLLASPALAANCPKCGAEVQPEWEYCPKCGADLHPKCPKCGADVEPGWTFCPKCGADLQEKKKAGEKTENAKKPEKKEAPEETPPQPAPGNNSSSTEKKAEPETPAPEAGGNESKTEKKNKEESLPEHSEPSGVALSFIEAIKMNDRAAAAKFINWNALYENLCVDREKEDLATFRKKFLDSHFEEGNRKVLARMSLEDRAFRVEPSAATVVYHYCLSPRAVKKRVYIFTLARNESGNWYITKLVMTLEPNR